MRHEGFGRFHLGILVRYDLTQNLHGTLSGSIFIGTVESLEACLHTPVEQRLVGLKGVFAFAAQCRQLDVPCKLGGRRLLVARLVNNLPQKILLPIISRLFRTPLSV